MATHANCDHESTKAARAKCRRTLPDGRTSGHQLPKMSPDEKTRVKAGKPKQRRTKDERSGDRLRRVAQQREAETLEEMATPKAGNPACRHDHVERRFLKTSDRGPVPRYVCQDPDCGKVSASPFGWAATAEWLRRDPKAAHPFSPEDEGVARCWCGKGKTARVHSDGPQALKDLFRF